MKEGTLVLDVAPMACFRNMCRNLKGITYVSLDYHGMDESLRADLTRLPLRDGSFDLIICYHVLEHIRDDQNALKELLRVMKSMGTALVQSPIDRGNETTREDVTKLTSERRRLLFGQEDHFRIYGRDYHEKLHESGFQVIRDTFIKTVDPKNIQRYDLTEDEIIYTCVKHEQRNRV